MFKKNISVFIQKKEKWKFLSNYYLLLLCNALIVGYC